MTFFPGNERLTIKQEFKGADEQDHLVVSTTMTGQIPEVPPDATVKSDPYTEIYQYSNNCKIQLQPRVWNFNLPLLWSPNGVIYLSVITSSSSQNYRVILPDGTTEDRRIQWRQTISFQGCQHGEALREMNPTQLLSVEQVFALYDAPNYLLRLAMSNKIGDVNGNVCPH